MMQITLCLSGGRNKMKLNEPDWGTLERQNYSQPTAK